MFLLISLFLAWGSFLNMVASRMLRSEHFCGRSRCPECHARIAWYDLVPLFSWIWLGGNCRSCGQPISWLYPFIEAATTLIFSLIIACTEPAYWFSYALLSSALLVTVRMDLEAMLVSTYTTLYLAPVGFLLACVGLLPLTPIGSVFGAISAYLFLWLVRYFFLKVTGKEGMGLGDVEMLAGLGAFFGPAGWWHILMIGAISGSVIGLILHFFNKNSSVELKFAFCPFLALGAWIYLFAPHNFFLNF